VTAEEFREIKDLVARAASSGSFSWSAWIRLRELPFVPGMWGISDPEKVSPDAGWLAKVE